MPDGERRAHRRWRVVAVVAVVAACILALGSAAWADVRSHHATVMEQAALERADAHLGELHKEVATETVTKTATTAKRDRLGESLVTTQLELNATNDSLDSSQVHAFLAGVSVSTLQTCLGGVQQALNALKFANTTQAAKDITAVSGPCTQLAGGATTGLVYPFDFPDPTVIVVGHTYFAYATNSVGGNVQILESTDLAHWSVVGNALPQLPAWAGAHFTWAPSVAFIGGNYDLYYTVDPVGSTKECISVATATQPQGPFTDRSSAPLECQNALGGSIDPSAFVDASGTSYLVWKSGGAGSSRIWSEQLAPSGTSFAPGSSPTTLLTPDQPWEGGTVEAPDLVEAGGHYDLFFSGNDWNSASYAVGVASCTGPLGPCTDATSAPILASGGGMAGPGGESVFADTSGSFWIAFHAWIPGAVGFPNSRGLYLRRLDLSSPAPSVVAPGAAGVSSG